MAVTFKNLLLDGMLDFMNNKYKKYMKNILFDSLDNKTVKAINPIMKAACKKSGFKKFPDGEVWAEDNSYYDGILTKTKGDELNKSISKGWEGLKIQVLWLAFKGKIKGIEPKAVAQFYCLITTMGVPDFGNGDFLVCKIITPIEKGLDYFKEVVKEKMSKVNLKTINKPIIVNECISKKATASIEKVFAYKGKIITASSKEEAVKKIINKQFKPGIKVGVSLKTLWEETKKHKTDFGYLLDTKEKGYYDLKFPADGQILCEDGEECTIKSINKKGDITLLNNYGIDETEFTLSKKESDIAIF